MNVHYPSLVTKLVCMILAQCTKLLNIYKDNFLYTVNCPTENVKFLLFMRCLSKVNRIVILGSVRSDKKIFSKIICQINWRLFCENIWSHCTVHKKYSLNFLYTFLQSFVCVRRLIVYFKHNVCYEDRLVLPSGVTSGIVLLIQRMVLYILGWIGLFGLLDIPDT